MIFLLNAPNQFHSTFNIKNPLWVKKYPVVGEYLIQLADYAETFPWSRIEGADRDSGIIASCVVYEYAKEVFTNASFLKL